MGELARGAQARAQKEALAATFPTVTARAERRRVWGMKNTNGEASGPRSRFTKQAERLRRVVPITKVIGEYVKLRGSRTLMKGNCPLHEEEAPGTLRVNPRENTFRCLLCGISGDAIDFLEAMDGLTYRQALEALEKLYYADRDVA